MKTFHNGIFLLFFTCLTSFLLHSAAVTGNSSVLPQTSLWQFSQLSRDTNSITETETFTQFTYTVTVDLNAIDNKACYSPEQGKSRVTCKTLNYALQMYHGINSVVFYLAASEDVYYLNFTYNATNQHNIWFYGNSSWSQTLIPTIKCLENVGLSFVNSFNISFSNVEFFSCGFGIQTSSSKNLSNTDFLTIRVGLYIYNCTNVTMHHIRVLNSSQATGVAMYDTDGIVEIYNSTFANNSVLGLEHSNQSGGGGFAVEFTYCKPGGSTCNDTYDPLFRRNKNSEYSFHNCTFRENVAINSAVNHAYIIKNKYYRDAAGEGGGLKIVIKGDANNNAFNLTDCQFYKNRGTWGGGLHIKLDNQSSNNSIVASNCNFFNNSALFGLNDTHTAGAIDMITTIQNFNKLHMKDCNFKYNQGIEGGGICFYIARQVIVDHLLEILIKDCLFESNSARIGSAISITTFPIFTSGILPQIQIHNSTFSSNHYLYLSTKFSPIYFVGIAAIYVSDIPLSFQNYATFSSNLGSALTAVGTHLNFTDTIAYFSNNSGSDGGAIALLGAAFILIGSNTHMTFVGNSATRYGGAIYNRYISIEHLLSTADCFIRYSEPLIEPDDWSAQLNFSGNNAHIGGCSIFTSSIVPCTWKHGYNAFHWKNWHYDINNAKCNYSEVVTEPTRFNSSILNWSLSDPIKIFPGDIFTIPLGAYDDLGNNITYNTIYSTQMLDDHSKSLAQVARGYTYIIANYMSITGKPRSNITLQLQTEGSRTMHVLLNITIQDCPLGFGCSKELDILHCNSVPHFQQIKCQCPSEKYTYRGNLRCNQDEFFSEISIDYWYGPVHFEHSNTTLLLMGIIPQVYRSQDATSDTVELPKYMDELDETLCGDAHRRGVLCGECIKGYAVAVNSRKYECVLCNSNSTTPGEFIKFLCAYIALTYFPMMIFFILIISFDIKLASSAAAGFILYAQTVSTGNFLYPQVPDGAAQVIRIIQMTVYGIFNLESFAFLMPPFCLNKDFTTLHVLCLDYVVAVFPLVMIMIIYLPYKCKLLCCKCNYQTRQDSDIIIHADPTILASQQLCCNKPPKSTLIHAFTAFMLLSYTKFGLASMKTVFLTELFDAQGAPKIQRIYLAGHLYFNDHQFLFPFGILAILVLVFVVFLPPLFLLGPLQLIDWLADKPRFHCNLKFWPTITIHTALF